MPLRRAAERRACLRPRCLRAPFGEALDQDAHDRECHPRSLAKHALELVTAEPDRTDGTLGAFAMSDISPTTSPELRLASSRSDPALPWTTRIVPSTTM